MSAFSWWACASCGTVSEEPEIRVMGEELAGIDAKSSNASQSAPVLLGSEEGALKKAKQSNTVASLSTVVSGADSARTPSTPDSNYDDDFAAGDDSQAAGGELAGAAASAAPSEPQRAGTAAEAQEAPEAQSQQASEQERGETREEPAYGPELSGKEGAAMRALKEELGEDGVAAAQAMLVPGEPLESCLLRFLKAASLRPPAAAKLVRAHAAWRAVERPAELALLGAGEICGCEDELLDRYMPTWHQGFDKQGRPVVFSHYGRFRFKPVLDAGVTVEKILRLHIRNSERTARLCGEQSRKLGRDIPNALIIMDTEGWDPANLRKAAFDWAKGLAKIDQEHYAERMGQLLIINAPASVNYFYRAAAWMLPEKSRGQVKIFAGREQWLPALLEMVDASQLPPEYGGSGPAAPYGDSP